MDVDDIEAIAASWSGIPVQRMTSSEASILSNMDHTLQQNVIGQDEAVNAVARSLRRTRCGRASHLYPFFRYLNPSRFCRSNLSRFVEL